MDFTDLLAEFLRRAIVVQVRWEQAAHLCGDFLMSGYQNQLMRPSLWGTPLLFKFSTNCTAIKGIPCEVWMFSGFQDTRRIS